MRFASVARQGSKLVLQWTGIGTLQETDGTGKPWTWTDVSNATNPLVINPTGARRFYRLRRIPLPADQNTFALYHFDEPSGNALDTSGNGWTGTLQNGASRAESAHGLGRALLLDGFDDYVSIAPQLLNDLPQGGVEANIWVESFIPNSVSPIISKGDTTLTQFVFGVSSNSISVAGGFGLDGLTVPVSIPLRTWTKVAATWDGAVRKLYVNDALVGQDASPFVPSEPRWQPGENRPA